MQFLIAAFLFSKGTNFRVKGTNFRVKSTNFRVKGRNFRVKGPNVRVKGPNFRVKCPNFRIKGPDFRVTGPNSVINPVIYRRQWAPVIALEVLGTRQRANTRSVINSTSNTATLFPHEVVSHWVKGPNFRINGHNFRVKGPNFRVRGTIFMVN